MYLPRGIWLRRIQTEIKNLQKHPRIKVTNIREGFDSIEFDIRLLGAAIVDPSGKIDKEHILHVTLSRQYPYQMPIVEWKSKIWHPNVSITGAVCIGALKTKNWNERHDLKEVAIAILNFLDSPDATDPFNKEAAIWYRQHPDILLKVKRENQKIQQLIEQGYTYDEILRMDKKIIIKEIKGAEISTRQSQTPQTHQRIRILRD